MKKITIVFAAICVAVLSFSQDQNTLQYGYISNVEPSQYLEMAKKDSVLDVILGKEGDPLRFQEARRSVLAREDLTKDEKVNLITQIGKKERENIQRQFTVETTCIWVEGVAAMAIRYFTIRKLKVPGGAFANGAAGGGIDAIADKLANGEFRALIKDGVGKGDWSGLINILESTAGGALAGGFTGKILDKLVKVPPNALLKNAEELSPKVAQYDKQLVDLGEEIKELKPQCSSLWDDAKNLRKQLQRATGEERASIEKQIADIESKANQLSALIKEKSSLFAEAQTARENISKTINSEIDKAINTLREGKNLVGMLLTDTTFLGDSPVDPNGVSLNTVAEAFVEGVLNVCFNRPLNDATEKIELQLNNIVDTYNKTKESIEKRYGDDIRVVLKGGVEENVYIDNSTGEIIQIDDGDVPANILNAVFNDDPAEPKDAQTLANEAFDKEIDKIVKDVADGDESLAQKIKDFVKGKIDEAIKKGEDWIENGGIRKTILEQVDKMIEGKVSSEDAQRIHNLVDTLCNVNKDGGESFCNTLGTDGKDLAVSLAVEALKKQLSDTLPEDAADMINAMLDVLKNKGNSDDYKKAVLGQIQELINKYVPYEGTAKTLNDIIQNISDGNAIDVMDSITSVGTALGIDLLKDTINKNLPPEIASRVNALLDGFVTNGPQGVADEALKQIYDLIDKYAPGPNSAQTLKDVIKGTLDGTVTGPDFANAATSIATDGIKKLINDSSLPDEVKGIVNAAVDGLAEDGITGQTENVGDYIQNYVTDQLGPDVGDAVREIYDAVVTPNVDAWDAVVKNAPTIGKAIGQKALAWAEKKIGAQIDKLIAKYPKLKSVLDRLGISGSGIVQGIKNVLSVLWNAPSLKDALKTLSSMAVNFLKGIAAKLIDMALEYAFNWLASNLVPKVVDWATSTLQRWANSVDNPLVKKGLEWLASQVSNCSKCANVRIKVIGPGDKAIKWVENTIKQHTSKGTKTVLETK